MEIDPKLIDSLKESIGTSFETYRKKDKLTPEESVLYKKIAESIALEILVLSVCIDPIMQERHKVTIKHLQNSLLNIEGIKALRGQEQTAQFIGTVMGVAFKAFLKVAIGF